jgi:hypothetical protein
MIKKMQWKGFEHQFSLKKRMGSPVDIKKSRFMSNYSILGLRRRG